MNRPGFCLLLGTALMASVTAELPETPLLRREGEMHSATIWRIATDATATLLATASDDKTVRLWDLKTGNASHVFRLPSDNGPVGKALAVAISPDGRLVVAGGFTGGSKQGEQLLYVFSARYGRLLAAIGDQPTSVHHLAFSPMVDSSLPVMRNGMEFGSTGLTRTKGGSDSSPRIPNMATVAAAGLTGAQSRKVRKTDGCWRRRAWMA